MHLTFTIRLYGVCEDIEGKFSGFPNENMYLLLSLLKDLSISRLTLYFKTFRTFANYYASVRDEDEKTR